MKKLLALVAATTMIGTGGAASAASITPNGPAQADGTVSLAKTQSDGTTATATCNLTHLAGTVSGGVAKITSATFASNGSSKDQLFCRNVKATNLPWTVTATSTTAGKATNVAASTPLGPCGPGTINGSYNNSTFVLSFSNQTLPGGCSITGSLKTHDNALKLVN